MHIEVLVEDASGACLVEHLLPRIIGPQGHPNSWRVHNYRGVGRIPRNLHRASDPSKRALLNQLPRLLAGYARTSGIDAVVVLVDTDHRDCVGFLSELQSLYAMHAPDSRVLFRLAIEEIEAWYLGDWNAIQQAYPKARTAVLGGYSQDSICGTWELLAEVIHKGGLKAIKKVGWPLPGKLKCQWADTLGPLLDVENNRSPSFCKFRDGLRRLVS